MSILEFLQQQFPSLIWTEKIVIGDTVYTGDDDVSCLMVNIYYRRKVDMWCGGVYERGYSCINVDTEDFDELVQVLQEALNEVMG